MATRATYCFIHYDGYPEGAASYFYDTFINPSSGGLGTQFIRANKEAEITDGHSSHGDTEYMYDIVGNGPEAEIKAYKLGYDNHHSRTENIFFTGELHEFINLYSKGIKDYKPFKFVKWGYNEAIINEKMGKHLLNNPLQHIRIWKNTEHRNSANWFSMLDIIKQMIKEFPGIIDDEIRDLIPYTCKCIERDSKTC